MKFFPSLFPTVVFRSLSLVMWALVVTVASSQVGTPLALAQSEEAVTKVKALNQKALAAYDNLELDEARKALTEALQICAQEGMNQHPWKARTHIHMGAILVGGFRQKDLAIKQFQRALEVQPEITLTPALRNPETQAAFEEAKKGGGDTKAGPTAATPAPTPGTTPAATTPSSSELKGIYHEPVSTSPANAKVGVRARAGKELHFKRMVLAYKPEGATGFLARDMDAESDRWFSATIPEPATKGGLVQYYIEARDEAGRPVASNGSEAEPHVVTLGKAGATGVDDASLVEAEENTEAAEPTPPASDDDRTGWVFGLSVGSGMGYVSGRPEVNPNSVEGENMEPKAIHFSGVAPSKLGHLNIEAGYAIQRGFILSLQARLQSVSGVTEAHNVTEENGMLKDRKFSPAKGAVAVFGKATWLLGKPGTIRPFASLMGGVGELRHVVDIGDRRKDCGPLKEGATTGNQPCVDTINSGPVFVGGSGGVIVKLGSSLGLTAGLNALLGIPKVALHADLNLGLLLML